MKKNLLVLSFCAAAASLAIPTAHAQGGPAMQSLINVSAASHLSGSLESQALQAGAPFTGQKGVGVPSGTVDKTGSLKPGNLGLQKSEAKPEPPKPLPIHKDKKKLGWIRAGGTLAAIGGLGLFAAAVATASTGPIGWAAALVFFGGLSAYLAHRALKKRK